jgi:xylulokinase
MGGLLLGIDIGTSSCKLAAFDTDGNVTAQASEDYTVYYPRNGWAEQSPVEWWEAVCRAVKKLLKNISPTDIAGIGIAGQSWSAAAVDGQGHVLCNTPIWTDTRALDVCGEMKASLGEERLFRASGNPVQPMYTMPKVLWYKKHQPDVYDKAVTILQSNGFIAFKLTGEITQDHSQGYGWNCYNMEAGTWDKDLCERLGVNPKLLPDLAACHQVIGSVTEQAANETGLLPGTPVVVGGLDAACGTLGAGVVNPGQTQEQGGQAGGMSICMDNCRMDKRLILSAHVVPGLWLLQGGTVGGGGALKWYAEELGGESFDALGLEAEKIIAGSEGLVFLPYLAGERSPIWDADAKGVFYGLDFSKTKGHFTRAVMEGVAYSLRHNLETAAEAGAETDTLHAMGGSAGSLLWTQIKADITGKRMAIPESGTATALGAAILAGVGTGIYSSFNEAVARTVKITRVHEPNADNKAVYERGYKVYRDLYERLKTLMSEVRQ